MNASRGALQPKKASEPIASRDCKDDKRGRHEGEQEC
jgi:hypothetical protein